MDKETRNKLRSIVTQCRTILERAIGDILQGQFGIHHSGLVETTESMTHLSAPDREYREQTIIHLEHIKAAGFKPTDAVQQLIRETAFTHLNRLCAYKMMEVRDLIRTTVSKGIKSQGFMFYMADHPEDEILWNGGEQELAYRHFLLWLGGTFANEIPALFSAYDPANRLFPAQRVLDQIIELINSHELKDIWEQDETIGWIYQYFTPKELRDQARKDSPAPRNTYELAFRNQFYTPRYVVQLLTDNTLGRIWYEMCHGKTKLKQFCHYLICHFGEVFLASGETAPAPIEVPEIEAGEELKQPCYIPCRKMKDPREIKMLDPACGSMHFGLYAFDLFEVIYEEAWDNHPNLMSDVRVKFGDKTEFMKAVPGMILENNIHGIDIDLRATQISALALWLRAQRSFQRLGIDRENRPRITKANVVCAEAMPGETRLLEDFIAELRPRALGEMVRQVFDKMKVAGEAGSLLEIEKDIVRIVAVTKTRAIEEQQKATDREGNVELFTAAEVKRLKADGQQGLDFSDITNEQFWDDAERRVIESLRNYTLRATNGRGFIRQLFAEDAERGFGFVEICRKRFDVVLMNPPFGEMINKKSSWVTEAYKKQPADLYCYFVLRGTQFLNDSGIIGCISSASFKTYVDYLSFRERFMISGLVRCFADLGWGVLDQAYVEACCYTIEKKPDLSRITPYFDVRLKAEKAEALLQMVKSLICAGVYWKRQSAFSILRDAPLIYWWPEARLKSFASMPSLGSLCREIGIGAGGHAIFNRVRWEVSPDAIGFKKRWAPFANGGKASPFRRDDYLVLDWGQDGKPVKDYLLKRYPYLKGNTEWKIQMEEFYGKPGITYGKKTTFFTAQTLPSGFIFSFEGIGVFVKDSNDLEWLLAYLNCKFVSWFLNTTCGLHKNAPYLKKLPVPEFTAENKKALSTLFRQGWRLQLEKSCLNELSPVFVSPFCGVDEGRFETSNCKEFESELKLILGEIDDLVLEKLGMVESDLAEEEPGSEFSEQSDLGDDDDEMKSDFSSDLISYAAGCVFGRWDVRFGTGERTLPEFQDPFALLPSYAPGMLRNCEPQDKYPLPVHVDGVLVEDDVVRLIRQVLGLICRDRAETMEQEACKNLSVKDLHDYFRKSGNGGFWLNHVNRYTKSRRKAPIYWLLQSAKKSFALWIYYHRLDRDTLNKALVNYVEPKLRLEGNRLQEFHGKRAEAGATGGAARDLDRKIERQEDLISELNDFQDKLRHAADFHLEPDLNDGVVLNIAPLWELVPWKEAKKYWEGLLKGEHDCSSIAKQLKAKGLIKG